MRLLHEAGKWRLDGDPSVDPPAPWSRTLRRLEEALSGAFQKDWGRTQDRESLLQWIRLEEGPLRGFFRELSGAETRDCAGPDPLDEERTVADLQAKLVHLRRAHAACIPWEDPGDAATFGFLGRNLTARALLCAWAGLLGVRSADD